MDFNPKQDSKLKNHRILNEKIYENFDGIHQEMLLVRFFPSGCRVSFMVMRDSDFSGHRR